MIYVIGYPSSLGGADTELWHNLRVWRRHGVDVTLIPTWKADPTWRARTEHIGCVTLEVEPERLSKLSELAGSTVVSFCNGTFLNHAAALKDLGARLVWANCMTFPFTAERKFLTSGYQFDVCLFQSNHQMEVLGKLLANEGQNPTSFKLVRGTFDSTAIAYGPKPRVPNDDFVFGRMARPDIDKWSSNTWKIYDSVPYARKRVVVMGPDDRVEKKMGPAPNYASVLRANTLEVPMYLSLLHCLVPINGGAGENWPRAGLEAMASGVAIVAQKFWGWLEMIEHGVTGFLAADDHEMAYYVAHLAYDEQLRLKMCEAAMQRLHDEFANETKTMEAWTEILGL